ncbi:UDP-glycosyltransferase UGT5-like isoform X1 [Coccinella septempunctata]|uniref:UDP-glycosyltransferase UGT5-like isoform X1 n=1 Tax=Coccinella septempunctata TaxID=41139 RepID=UPI001D074B34|nr:UDP-glycosyltransferase UGT5-like isoform X1 [Coccinella septempunctata]
MNYFLLSVKCVLLLSFVCVVSGANILAYFFMPSKSHQFVFQPIWKELALRGHNVTVITTDPLNETIPNLREIDVSESYSAYLTHDLSNLRRETTAPYVMIDFIQDLINDIFKIQMNNEEVKEILRLPKKSFDLIILESHNKMAFGLKHKFDAPAVAISSFGLPVFTHYLHGNPIHPVLYPDFMSEVHECKTLSDKVESTYFTLTVWLLVKYKIGPEADLLARTYFGKDMPYLDELEKDCLLFENTNPLFSDKRPKTPDVMEFSAVLPVRDPLTADLKQILDNAKEGVVYFSLGTNVRFDHVQGDVKKTIMEALGDLPYTVICKWESEKLEGQPKNVHLRKWLPQQAILAHPNVKAFVTQGGLQSAEEAIINAVPLVVIPFLGDQPLNAKILTSKGMAETISPKDLNRRILTESIMKVAQDEKYRNKAKELRDIFLDQPQSGIDKVIWWCEYVIRHKGAKHLRSPAADIPLWEYFMLDVLAVVLIALYLVYKITKVTIKILLELFKRSTASTTSKKKKKN